MLEIINEFSKIAGYKINTQKSVVILYPNNEQLEKETNKTILFALKRITYLGIKKEMKDLYNETIKH